MNADRKQTLLHIVFAIFFLSLAWIYETSPIFELPLVYDTDILKIFFFQCIFVYDILFLSIYVTNMTREWHSSNTTQAADN